MLLNEINATTTTTTRTKKSTKSTAKIMNKSTLIKNHLTSKSTVKTTEILKKLIIPNVNDKYTEIKLEHFIIYNGEKHPFKQDDYKKDVLAQKALNLAITKFNDHVSTSEFIYIFEKLLDGTTVQPVDDKIYLFKVKLIETNCKNTKKLRKNFDKLNCIKKVNGAKHLTCSFDVHIIPSEKNEKDKFKFNRIYCV